MLPDWPHDNNGCCYILHQPAQWNPPRCHTGIVNSNLPSGKSMVLTIEYVNKQWVPISRTLIMSAVIQTNNILWNSLMYTLVLAAAKVYINKSTTIVDCWLVEVGQA